MRYRALERMSSIGATSCAMAGERSSEDETPARAPVSSSRSTAGQRRMVGATLAATTLHPASECVTANPTFAIA